MQLDYEISHGLQSNTRIELQLWEDIYVSSLAAPYRSPSWHRTLPAIIFWTFILLAPFACSVLIASSVEAQAISDSMPAGANPSAIAINPSTHLIYVANSAGNTVTVLDEVIHAVTATEQTGTNPVAIAIDPVSNQTFVANFSSNTVSVIDGNTNTVSSAVVVGQAPYAIAVNPVTHQIYVANSSSNTVSIINGKTLTVVATVDVGTDPVAIAANPITNQVYVANRASNTVTVIDGANLAVATTVTTGEAPDAIAVNPVTNQVYVANLGGNSVTTIDGAAQAVSATISTGTSPSAIALNSFLNQIYVANLNSGNITIIDGVTNASTTVGVGSGPQAIAVNPISNQIYVANILGSNLTVIDGISHKVTHTVQTGLKPDAIAVDIVTNHIYVANNGSSDVTVIDGTKHTIGSAMKSAMNQVSVVSQEHVDGNKTAKSMSNYVPIRLRLVAVRDRQTLAIAPLFKTTNDRPSFMVAATTIYTTSTAYSNIGTASNPPPTAVYYQLDGLNGTWAEAKMASFTGANPGSFSINLSKAESLGRHILYVFAAYGEEGTPVSSGNGTGNSPEVGNPQRLFFSIQPTPTVTILTTDATPNGRLYTVSVGSAISFTASIRTAVTGIGVNAGQIAFYDGKQLLGTKDLASGSTFQTRSLTEGQHAISVQYVSTGKPKYLKSSSNVLFLNVVGTLSKNARSTSH